MSKKIGLFGGTFDPVHNGHVAIAESAYKELGLDEIWFLPELNPKFKQKVTPYRHRLNMLKLATYEYGYMVVDRLEMQKQGTDHGLDSLKLLNSMFPGNKYIMIMGADAFAHFPKWQNAKEFTKYTEFYIFPRNNQNIDKTDIKPTKCVYFISRSVPNNFMNNVSSSKIRSNLRSEDISRFMPTKVLEYILNNNLYLKSKAKS